MADVDGQIVRAIKVTQAVGRLRTGPIKPDRVWEAMEMQHVFSERERKVLDCMARHLQCTTNRVVDAHGQYLSVPHLAALVPMDAANVRKALKGLLYKNAVLRVEGAVPYWIVNPDLYYKGTVKESVRDLFRGEARMRREHGAMPVYVNRNALTVLHPQ